MFDIIKHIAGAYVCLDNLKMAYMDSKMENILHRGGDVYVADLESIGRHGDRNPPLSTYDSPENVYEPRVCDNKQGSWGLGIILSQMIDLITGCRQYRAEYMQSIFNDDIEEDDNYNEKKTHLHYQKTIREIFATPSQMATSLITLITRTLVQHKERYSIGNIIGKRNIGKRKRDETSQPINSFDARGHDEYEHGRPQKRRNTVESS